MSLTYSSSHQHYHEFDLGSPTDTSSQSFLTVHKGKTTKGHVPSRSCLYQLVRHEGRNVCSLAEKLMRRRQVALAEQLFAPLHVNLPLSSTLFLLPRLGWEVPSVEHQVGPHAVFQEKVHAAVRAQRQAKFSLAGSQWFPLIIVGLRC